MPGVRYGLGGPRSMREKRRVGGCTAKRASIKAVKEGGFVGGKGRDGALRTFLPSKVEVVVEVRITPPPTALGEIMFQALRGDGL